MRRCRPRARIDDIQDNSKLRRGIPVAHSVFGVASTINTANYVYFQCMAKVGRRGRCHQSPLYHNAP